MVIPALKEHKRLMDLFLNDKEIDKLSPEQKEILNQEIAWDKIIALDFHKLIEYLSEIVKIYNLNINIPDYVKKINDEWNIELKRLSFRRRYIVLGNSNLKNLNIRQMVDEFLEIQPIIYDKSKLYWTWDYKNNLWKIIDETDALNLIDNELGCSWTTKPKFKNEIVECIQRIGRLKAPKDAKKTWVQFKDCIIDVETGQKYPISSEYFITNPIPWNIGKSQETPIINEIFEQWVGKEYVSTLYEIMAFCLVPDYFIHRIFCFVGSGMNGKSKYLELLTRFVGMPNCTTSEIDLLCQSRFESSKLYKKLVCMVGETNFNLMEQTAMLKRLSGGDMISFEYKNKIPFEDYNYAKMIISTNTLPTTTDKTFGFYRRWVIIRFPNTFTESIDVLRNIPKEEYENLCLKSIEILKNLLQKRAFTNEGTVQERMIMYEETSNPLQKFLSERTVKDSEGYLLKYELSDEFNIWLKQHGYRIWSKKEIGNEMQELYEDGRKDFLINGSNKQYRVWLGIRWRSVEEKQQKLKDDKEKMTELTQRTQSPLLTSIYFNKSNKVEKEYDTSVESAQTTKSPHQYTNSEFSTGSEYVCTPVSDGKKPEKVSSQGFSAKIDTNIQNSALINVKNKLLFLYKLNKKPVGYENLKNECNIDFIINDTELSIILSKMLTDGDISDTGRGYYPLFN